MLSNKSAAMAPIIGRLASGASSMQYILRVEHQDVGLKFAHLSRAGGLGRFHGTERARWDLRHDDDQRAQDLGGRSPLSPAPRRRGGDDRPARGRAPEE